MSELPLKRSRIVVLISGSGTNLQAISEDAWHIGAIETVQGNAQVVINKTTGA